MIHRIPSANWHIALSNALNFAVDGDEIIVHTPEQAELARLAIERMQITAQFTITIEPEANAA